MTDQIINRLKESLADDRLSKEERRSIKSLVGDFQLDNEQLNFLRNQMYDLATERLNENNFRAIVDWLRIATSALAPAVLERSSVCFSPGDACRDTIIRQLQIALRRLDICVFTISDDRITDAILAAKKRNIAIRILTDNDKLLDAGSDIQQLSRAGIPVKIDNTPNHMHHKFMIVDERCVLTGSYNWTRSAAKFNHENLLVTHEPGAVKPFLKEFEKLWSELDEYSA